MCKSRGSPLTSRLAGISEDDDVVKGPRVVGVRGVESQLGCTLGPQGHQEGRVHHGDLKASTALAVLGGEVVRRAAVIALQKVGGSAL